MTAKHTPGPKLCKFSRQFILDLEHKIGVLADTDDLRESYNLTPEQVEIFAGVVRRASIQKLTTIEVPAHMFEAVRGEMENQAQIYLDNQSELGNRVFLAASLIRKQLKQIPE